MLTNFYVSKIFAKVPDPDVKFDEEHARDVAEPVLYYSRVMLKFHAEMELRATKNGATSILRTDSNLGSWATS